MAKTTLPTFIIAASALLGQAVWAERFPEVPRPIDYFVNGEEILAVTTLRDNLQSQGRFPLGKALFTIGRTDLLGLNRELDSFDNSTLETPLGGDFSVDMEKPVHFHGERALRATRGL